MNACFDDPARPAAIVLAKAAITAAPVQEMTRIAAQLEASGRVAKAVFAFSEQGLPSLRSAVRQLRDEGWRQIVVLPLLVPFEPGYHNWIAQMLQRWHAEAGDDWPTIRVGRGLSEAREIDPLLDILLDSALSAPPASATGKASEGSVVSDWKYRVLVCQGGPCNDAGAAAVWGHLRNQQAAMKLPEQGAGMRSAKATCLGPCGLAPVVQVYPEGTFYGGVNESGMDRIIHEHLLGGKVVEDIAYHPGEGKQKLRRCAPVLQKAERKADDTPAKVIAAE